MKTSEKLLITASVEEVTNALASVFDEIFRHYLTQLSKPKEDTYLSRTETAKLLNISLVTLHTWTNLGKLSAHKVDGSSKVYYSEKDVRNLIVSSRKTVDYES
jgi:hypothetical protein